MLRILKMLWDFLTLPSKHAVWEKAFDKLQAEREENGISPEYWRIWYDEVCPAFRDFMTPNLVGGISHMVLEDMDKPLEERKYF